MKFTTKALVATAIGIALFFVIGKFVQIPTGIVNTYLAIQYGLLTSLATIFGPFVGAIIGLCGHFLIDSSSGFGVWWSWVIASAVHGVIIGLFSKAIDVENTKLTTKKYVVFGVACLLASVISWSIVAVGLDVLIYQEDFAKVLTQSIFATTTNFLVSLVVGLIIIKSYNSLNNANNSLEIE